MRRISRLTGDGKLRRKLFAYALKKGTGMRLKEIGKMAGIRSIYAVSKAVSQIRSRQ